MKSRMLVTGSSGLIGSEVVEYFSELGWQVDGIDNNMRADFFGPSGDTRWNQRRLSDRYPTFSHHEVDIRDRRTIDELIKRLRPNAIVHAAAQPSHDLAATRVFDDFEVNAVGTLNLLEAARNRTPQSPFIYLSTNKVYGDSPNRLSLIETPTRWDYGDARYAEGIDETFPVDQSTHSVFGASKLSADVMVQEYGRYFGMPTCTLRGGCLTGPNHNGVELHGFLSFMIKCYVERRKYRVFGYKGKQVRDNIHAVDVAAFIWEFINAPRSGEVYNIGGGRDNSISILEAFSMVEEIDGKKMDFEYDERHRVGDHICYISDLSKARRHYPRWKITKPIRQVFLDIVDGWTRRALA